MAENTKIEWTRGEDGSAGATWNVVTGCSLATPGCTNCYAMRLAGTRLQHHPSRVGLTRDTKAGPVWTGEVRFNKGWLTQPLQWRRPRKIFVAAHGDLFHEGVPDDVLDQVFAVMALCPQHTFQVLTKRADRMRAYLTRPAGNGLPDVQNRVAFAAVARVLNEAGIPWKNEGIDGPWRSRAIQAGTVWPLPNVWLGVSVEDQRRADERIPDLLATPAAVRWISAEPLLGPVDLMTIKRPAPLGSMSALRCEEGQRSWLDWVVVGGESGPGARPMHPDWARSLRDQCAAAGVPYLFKQHGAWVADRAGDRCVDLDGRNMPNLEPTGSNGHGTVRISRVGKKAAGRLLDGVTHDGFPEAVR